MVHSFKSGEILKLLGKFRTQGLALFSKLVDFCGMFCAKRGENNLVGCHLLLVTYCDPATLVTGVMLTLCMPV